MDRKRNRHVISRRTDALVERTGSPADTLPAREERLDAVESSPAADHDLAARASRIVNFVLAAVALFFALPLLLLIAIAIKLTSRGPVLYTQERVGLDRRTPRIHPGNHRRVRDIGGKPFTIYKFRTMRVDAEAHSGAIWATQNDPRVTPVGRFLRQYRLDEIPQLLNVMRGEMNIVGPRPERPTIFAELREHIKEYPQRQRAKPGITGLAQIYHHYDRSLDDVRTKVRFDLEYIERRSLWEDLRIMVRTLPVILFRRGGW
jgi:lipopolysaccharide/colanic/teichoic acid biosynthesis glycosyltransferase